MESSRIAALAKKIEPKRKEDAKKGAVLKKIEQTKKISFKKKQAEIEKKQNIVKK